jgi:hypothetical protein
MVNATYTRTDHLSDLYLFITTMKHVLIYCIAMLSLSHVTAQVTGAEIISTDQTALTSNQTSNIIGLQITLNGIFMGECGNPNDCHHERVAGFVTGVLQDSWHNSIPNTTGTTVYWGSDEYSLVCNNYPQEPATSGNGDQLPDYSRIASNILKTLNYTIDDQMLANRQYEFVISFNLGNQHQDNPFASVGNHWLRQGEDRIVVSVNLKDYYNQRVLLLGPYQTNSDRCHEYYLQFNIVGQ